MMFIDLLPSPSLMFTSMQQMVKSAILKPPDSISHSRFRVGRTKESMNFSFKSCTLFSPCCSLQLNALATFAKCSLIIPHVGPSSNFPKPKSAARLISPPPLKKSFIHTKEQTLFLIMLQEEPPPGVQSLYSPSKIYFFTPKSHLNHPPSPLTPSSQSSSSSPHPTSPPHHPHL